MENDQRYTINQEEMIYVCNQIDNEENIDKNIKEFFTELINRRRNDPVEGGLQACAVVFPDKSAMKICENDGTAPHANAFINLVKHLNGNRNYISVQGTSNFMISRNENKQLIESGIGIRFLDGADELMLAINSNINSLSSHQVDILRKLIVSCKTLKDNNTYKNVKIGCYIADCKIDFEDLNDEHFNNLLDGIESLQKSLINSK